jgi:hypothetical protein
MFEGVVRMDRGHDPSFVINDAEGEHTVEGLDAAVSSLFPDDGKFKEKKPPRRVRVRVTIEVVEE